jgi:hypothetical protein
LNELDYVWKHHAALNTSDQVSEAEFLNFANEIKKETEKVITADLYEEAMRWLTGLNRFVSHSPTPSPVPDELDAKYTMILAGLINNLLTVTADVLGINRERITLEQELTFCTAAQEFSKIVSWIGANVDQIGYATPNLRTDQGSKRHLRNAHVGLTCPLKTRPG